MYSLLIKVIEVILTSLFRKNNALRKILCAVFAPPGENGQNAVAGGLSALCFWSFFPRAAAFMAGTVKKAPKEPFQLR